MGDEVRLQMNTHDVTVLLNQWSDGDQEALAALTPLVYRELHTLAARYLRSQAAGHTLQPTALVNEAYLKLVAPRQVPTWQNRAHFLAVAARTMRCILVDHARSRHALKRGGQAIKVSLDRLGSLPAGEQDEQLLALDEALIRLAELSAVQARIVEMRYFGGMTIEQTAAALGSSPATIKRQWTLARLFLRAQMGA
ncbi:sigma-70 family RNA polymerase sigma factor [Gloeobacter kilaueensis]|nr:sigma-70 family RNA polymerase sigma factor [Gloeobacter kilaueensis]